MSPIAHPDLALVKTPAAIHIHYGLKCRSPSGTLSQLDVGLVNLSSKGIQFNNSFKLDAEVSFELAAIASDVYASFNNVRVLDQRLLL